MLAPYRSSGRLQVLQPCIPMTATSDGDQVTSVTVRNARTDDETVITAPYVLDATETGDLLALTGCEYVTGFESSTETGEPSARMSRSR
jgi:FAD-dependent oxidoreductase family protein